MKPQRILSELGGTANQAPFLYDDYVKAKQSLQSALAGPRFYALLSAPSGMGKTSLLRDISASLDRHRHQVVYVSCAQASVVSIVRYLASLMHVTPRRSYLETARVLSQAIEAQTAHLLLWVDEADQVDAAVLGQVRMLAESELGCEPLMSVVFSGLAALSAQLDAPSLFPLKRRITHRLMLAGLRRDELEPFIQHRFGAQQAERLPQSMHDELFERTCATPALIDKTVRHALVNCPQSTLDPEAVRAALDIAGL
jgi:general secretion pathway protein A